MDSEAEVKPCISLEIKSIYWSTAKTDNTTETSKPIKLILTHLLTPNYAMILANGMHDATRATKYIRLTHNMFPAWKFKSIIISGSATTVMFAINCCVSCDNAAIIIISVFLFIVNIMF